MRIILCAFDNALENAWKKALPDFLPDLERGHSVVTMCGDITALTVTAVVSPANSHGHMRGGVDLAYARRFVGVEQAVRTKNAMLPGKLLPVGEALSVHTGDAAIPYLISAPTMETPRLLFGPEPVVAASRAAVRCARTEGYDFLAFPGMGTGAGGLDVSIAAWAMLQGICEGLRFGGT